MSIFETVDIQTPEPTREQIGLQERNKMAQAAAGFLLGLKEEANRMFVSLWQNPNATPHEILAAFNTSAGQLFFAFIKLQDLIEQIDPSYVRMAAPEGLYTINEDGTVTING